MSKQGNHSQETGNGMLCFDVSIKEFFLFLRFLFCFVFLLLWLYSAQSRDRSQFLHVQILYHGPALLLVHYFHTANNVIHVISAHLSWNCIFFSPLIFEFKDHKHFVKQGSTLHTALFHWFRCPTVGAPFAMFARKQFSVLLYWPLVHENYLSANILYMKSLLLKIFYLFFHSRTF